MSRAVFISIWTMYHRSMAPDSADTHAKFPPGWLDTWLMAGRRGDLGFACCIRSPDKISPTWICTMVNILIYIHMLVSVFTVTLTTITGTTILVPYPDSKVHGANMSPIWGRQNPGGPHVGPMNVAIWVDSSYGYPLFKLFVGTFFKDRLHERVLG